MHPCLKNTPQKCLLGCPSTGPNALCLHFEYIYCIQLLPLFIIYLFRPCPSHIPSQPLQDSNLAVWFLNRLPQTSNIPPKIWYHSHHEYSCTKWNLQSKGFFGFFFSYSCITLIFKFICVEKYQIRKEDMALCHRAQKNTKWAGLLFFGANNYFSSNEKLFPIVFQSQCPCFWFFFQFFVFNAKYCFQW